MSEVAPQLGRGFDERIPLVLILDTSASMGRPTEVPRIAELNTALSEWLADAREQPTLRNRFEIAIVVFGSDVRVLDPMRGKPGPVTAATAFAAVSSVQPPELQASGVSLMLPAITTALDLAAERKRQLAAEGVPSQRPLLWLLTDGAPTDDCGGRLEPGDLASTAQRIRPLKPSGTACSSPLESAARTRKCWKSWPRPALPARLRLLRRPLPRSTRRTQ